MGQALPVTVFSSKVISAVWFSVGGAIGRKSPYAASPLGRAGLTYQFDTAISDQGRVGTPGA